MMRLVGVELFKFRTQRAHVVVLALGLALPILQLGLFFLATQLVSGQGPQLSLESANMQRQLLSSTGISIVVLLLAILGITAEFRHGTISSTVRAVPKRHIVVVAKVITYALIALAYGVMAAVLNQIGARAILAVEGVDLVVPAADLLGPIAKSVLALVLFAILGVGVAALVANQAAAILVVILEPFASSIVAALLPQVGKYLPSQAIQAFTRSDEFFTGSLSPEAGLAVFVLYVIVAVGAGIIAFSRRDIS